MADQAAKLLQARVETPTAVFDLPLRRVASSRLDFEANLDAASGTLYRVRLWISGGGQVSLNSILISLPAEETQQHPLGAPWRQCPVQVPEFLQATIPISTRTEQSAALARSPANDSWSHKYEMRYAYVNRTEPAASPRSPAGPVPPEPPARRPRYLVLTPEPTGRARGSSTHFFD